MANVNYLADRAELLRFTRTFFDQRGFLEVQPPSLSRDCVVDAYLDPITVDAKEMNVADTRLPERFYLQTSPESAMKRMLAAGAPSIYSIGPVFRAGEAGRHHNVEFTMLEWYEVDGDFESAIRMTGDYVVESLNADDFDRISYRQAFQHALELDPIDARHEQLVDAVARCASSLEVSTDHDRDDLLDLLLSAAVAPTLGIKRPLVLTDYPLSQAALAKRSKTDPACAARFEVFVQGIEIANGYDELLDAQVLRDRFEQNNRKRIQTGREQLPVETTLLTAMRLGLPQCSGVALGIDRLLMLKVGADQIRQVLPFGICNA